jgi:hypothetical protein
VDAFNTPLVDCFRSGDAPREVRLLAARGGLDLPPETQLVLLMLLASDADPEVKAAADATIVRIPEAPLAALLAEPDVPANLRDFFTARGGASAASGAADAASPADAAPWVPPAAAADPARPPDAIDATGPGDSPADIEADPERRGAAQRLAMLTVSERMKVAMQGTREERSILVRDSNRLVSSAVLSSPKLSESEIEAIARMTNVSVDVLRVVGTSRVWTKNYAVVAALTRNAKTPIAVAMHLLHRLTERDVKGLSTDRNVPEPVRLAARKIYAHGVARRQ